MWKGILAALGRRFDDRRHRGEGGRGLGGRAWARVSASVCAPGDWACGAWRGGRTEELEAPFGGWVRRLIARSNSVMRACDCSTTACCWRMAACCWRMISINSALGSCSNCLRVMAEPPAVMVNASGPPGSWDAGCRERSLCGLDIQGVTIIVAELDPHQAPPQRQAGQGE